MSCIVKFKGTWECHRIQIIKRIDVHIRDLKIQTSYTAFQNFQPIQIYSKKEALPLIIDAKFFKFQFTLIRLQANKETVIYILYAPKISEENSNAIPEKTKYLSQKYLQK